MINTSLFALFGRYKGDASLAGVLENIQRGTYKQLIDETREALASGDKELAAKLKKKLPAFTPQATYSGKRLDPHITRYNQLVVLDIDHVGERELERITPLATEAPYTVAYFRSPSGDGAKLIAYAATDETATPGNHRRVYEAMSRWYTARLGVELDTSGSDIGGFASYRTIPPYTSRLPTALGWRVPASYRRASPRYPLLGRRRLARRLPGRRKGRWPRHWRRHAGPPSGKAPTPRATVITSSSSWPHGRTGWA